MHGSRAKGTAILGQSDIDIMLVISDREFGCFAAKIIAESSGRTQKNIVKTFSDQQRINGWGISKTFEATIWDHVFPTLPKGEFSKVQVSIMTEKPPFNTGPYIKIE
ncbi:hypothetical protein GWI68_11715 [Proteus sp. G2669]|uniref:hypothetical protein n=1 Tax=Proteus sp. G2669 TaxID=2698881 RepID=UPI001412FE15|nr:hypothetical protein [Proteus sp. G2669]